MGASAPKESVASGNLSDMENASDLLMLQAVSATCGDCAGERVFVPVEDGYPGEFCCTSCDGAVFLLTVGAGRKRGGVRRGRRVVGAA